MADSLLLIIPEGDMRDAFASALEEKYALLCADSGERGLALLHEKRDEIRAVLISLELARANDYTLIRQMDAGDVFNSIPLIAVTPEHPAEGDDACLEHGLFELISARTWPAVLRRRIENAIRAKDSVTFYEIEKMLKGLPSNIFLKDREGRYVFATHYWQHLKDADKPGWSIRGKTDLEIRKDQNNARKAMEADRKILETGQGTSYVIEEVTDGVSEFLQLIKQPLFDDSGNVTGIIALINNVTEQQLLKKELEKQVRIDSLTGILNKRSTEDLICRMLHERKPDQHDAMLMIDLDAFKSVNDRFGHAAGDWALTEMGHTLRGCFRAFDACGRVGGDEFMVFLRDIEPEAVLRSARRVLEQAKRRFDESELAGQVSISIGIALCPDHGADFETLYHAADRALYHVKNHGKGDLHVYSPEDEA